MAALVRPGAEGVLSHRSGMGVAFALREYCTVLQLSRLHDGQELSCIDQYTVTHCKLVGANSQMLGISTEVNCIHTIRIAERLVLVSIASQAVRHPFQMRTPSFSSEPDPGWRN